MKSEPVIIAPAPTVAAGPPKCLGCGKRLSLTIDPYGNGSIDKMNFEAGTQLCQTCLIEQLREG